MIYCWTRLGEKVTTTTARPRKAKRTPEESEKVLGLSGVMRTLRWKNGPRIF